jgi:hypothetical protein
MTSFKSDNQSKIIRIDFFPIALWRSVKKYQMQLEEQGQRVTFPETCIILLEKAVNVNCN